jgi:hypothetical protein
MEPNTPADEAAAAVPDPRDRRHGPRRSGADRRAGKPAPAGVERRHGDRRASDRRTDPPVPEQYRAGARHMNEYPLLADEMEFINAMNAYRQKYAKPFPTWSEVLHVLKALGYRKEDGGEPPSRSS